MKPFSFGCLAKRTSRKKDQQQKVNKPQFPITWKTKQKEFVTNIILLTCDFQIDSLVCVLIR
jgi:hypothetical protein